VKKTFAVIGLSVSLLLTGCGGHKAVDSAKPTKPAAQQPKDAPEKDENGKIVFTAAGQETDVPNVGHVTLKKIKTVNETVDMKLMKVTIKDIKLLHIDNINPQFKQGIEQLIKPKANRK
jgi:hypothetical protein